MKYKLFAIRPYYAAIKDRVFDLLTAVDAGVPVGWATDERESDAMIVAKMGATVADSLPDALLIPFHSITIDGQRQSGLTILKMLRENMPEILLKPIVMPVSSFGRAALLLQQKELYSIVPEKQIFVISEEMFNDESTVESLRDHLTTGARGSALDTIAA